MLISAADSNELAVKGKEIIMKKINEAAELNDKVVVGLSGGVSLHGIYRELAKADDDILKSVHFFWVDESVLPLDNDGSSYKTAYNAFLKELLEKGLITEKQIHPMPYQEARSLIVNDYNNELNVIKGALLFDVIIAEAGEDGSIASLFPQHHSVKNDSTGYIYIDDAPKQQHERITASRRMIESSGAAIAIFSIAARKALKHYLDGTISIEKCPIKAINRMKEHVVLTDIR